MPKISIWNSGIKSNNYKYIDKQIAQYFNMGGTCVFVHKYLGTYDQDGNPTGDPTTIQDMVFLENRDRQYDPDVMELRGIYNVQDSEFDLKQFGIFLNNDDLFIEFHLNAMIALMGRKLMNGDVLELPHQRDDFLLDETKPSINKFYVITDASRASSGYSQTWFPHVWRVKCTPMTDSQEYKDILAGSGEDPLGLPMSTQLQDVMSNIALDMGINDAVVAEAKQNVSRRNFETQQFYVVPGDDKGQQYPWVFAGDGIPPNGAQLTGSGIKFPDHPQDGDYYLRIDYEPFVLYQRDSSRWRRVEIDYRKNDWSMAHRLLELFINNNKTTVFDDGTTAPEKQALSKAVLPKADF